MAKVIVGIRWMSGSNCNNLQDLFDNSMTQVYDTMRFFSVLRCKHLGIHLDKDPSSIQKLYDEITLKSTNGILGDRCWSIRWYVIAHQLSKDYDEK